MLHLYLPASRSITLLVSLCGLLSPHLGASRVSQAPESPFPEILRGDWFSWEDGRGQRATIDESVYERRGAPLAWRTLSSDVFDYVFEIRDCRFCSRFLVRSWNIIERFDGSCHFKHNWRSIRSTAHSPADETALTEMGSRNSRRNVSISVGKSVNNLDVNSQTSSAQKYTNTLTSSKEIPKISPTSNNILERDDIRKKPEMRSLVNDSDQFIKSEEQIHPSERSANLKINVLKVKHRKIGTRTARAVASNKRNIFLSRLSEMSMMQGGENEHLDLDNLCSFAFDLNDNKYVSPLKYFRNASEGSTEFQHVDEISDTVNDLQENFPPSLHTTNSPEIANASRSRQTRVVDGANRVYQLQSDEEEHYKMSTFDGSRINAKGHGILMHRRDPVPITCLSFLRGHYKMAWRNTRSSSALCAHPGAEVTSCPAAGERLTADSEQMKLVYRRCPSVKQSYDAEVSYSCLGSWHIGTRHYLAVANLRQRNDVKRYRCLLHDLTEPQLVIGASKRPGCSGLFAANSSPVMMMLTPVEPSIPPGCTFPPEYRGTWQGTGRGEPKIRINATHIVTSLYRGAREVRVIRVCTQNEGKRYLLAVAPDNGCNVEYVCWEMLPRHHNILRYRKGRHSSIASFDVCDHRAFNSGRHWKYDTLIADPPDPVACPVKGRFIVAQEGSMPFVPRVLGGVTVAPLDTYPCKHRSPVWTVCDARGYGTSTIVFDLNACTDVDSHGRPLVVKEVPDYEMLCAGHWQENLKSYLVTFSASDPVSRYRCWVYRRVSSQEVKLSASVGSACGLHQTHQSSWYNESAQVALSLKLEERLHDQCPMEFDLGRDPWASDKRLKSLPVVFSFTSSSGFRNFCASYLLVMATCAVFLFY